MAGNSSNSRPGSGKKVSDKTQGEVRQDKWNDVVKLGLDAVEWIGERTKVGKEIVDNICTDDVREKVTKNIENIAESGAGNTIIAIGGWIKDKIQGKKNPNPKESPTNPTTPTDDSPEEEEKP